MWHHTVSFAPNTFNFVVFYYINSSLPLTAIFGCNEVHIANILAARFDVMMYGVGGDGADLHEPIVLDEDRVAGEVAVDYWWHAAVEVTVDSRSLL